MKLGFYTLLLAGALLLAMQPARALTLETYPGTKPDGTKLTDPDDESPLNRKLTAPKDRDTSQKGSGFHFNVTGGNGGALSPGARKDNPRFMGADPGSGFRQLNQPE
jgi:hypothetical protein